MLSMFKTGILDKLRGDKAIWSFVALLALFSFMPVFSASSNLSYLKHGNGNTLAYFLKHFLHVVGGLSIIFFIHKIPYRYYKKICLIVLPLIWGLLIFTLMKRNTIGGVEASRWIEVPFLRITFQTSTVASIFLFIYVARYLAKKRQTPVSLETSFLKLWIPVFITLGLILPTNLSTTLMIFSMVMMLAFVGKYPFRQMLVIIGLGIVSMIIFFALAKLFPDSRFFSRVNTWESRIENFIVDKEGEDNYQVEMAKIAIASGNLYGLGPGKSVQKNFLPQSSSDFIYAIIIEEYGLIGGLGVLLLYLLLCFRFVIAAHKATDFFAKLLVIGLGFPIIFQALLNMGVAVESLPVTGQTLPLISTGGSSFLMICFSLGIILNVTQKEEEIALEKKEAEQREVEFRKKIEAEENQDTQEYSIEDNTTNPMEAVRKKQ